MKIKQNVILLTIAIVSFATVHADYNEYQEPQEGKDVAAWGFGRERREQRRGHRKDRRDQRRDRREGRKGEFRSLSFQNATPYDVTVYASVRNQGNRRYGKNLVKLGTVPASGASNDFAVLNNAYIGRGNTQFWVEVTGTKGNAPAINSEPFNQKKGGLRFKQGLGSEPVHLKFNKKEGPARDTVEMLLEVKKGAGGLDMILSPAGAK